VAEAMQRCLESPAGLGNPSAVTHFFGREAAAAVEGARAAIARVIDAQPDEIVFTSGATEADNLAILGLARGRADRGRHLISSRTEHKAVLDACKALHKRGCSVSFVEPTREGRIEPEAVLALLRPDTQLVSIMHANNETGVLLPVVEMARLADERRIVFHTDAVQAAGKIAIDLDRGPMHLLSISAHKFHGPKGAGALYVRPGMGLPPLLFGGGQERGRRAGTENVPGIVGMGAAAELARVALPGEMPRVAAMRDVFEAALRERFAGVKFHGDPAHRLPNTSNFALPGLEAHDLLAGLDRLEVACSIGSACSSGSPDASHVLRAMGVPDELARSSLRVSFSRMNKPEEALRSIEALAAAVERLAPDGLGD
jgi:cysteine desulfurase